jgi:hypothetical protein
MPRRKARTVISVEDELRQIEERKRELEKMREGELLALLKKHGLDQFRLAELDGALEMTARRMRNPVEIPENPPVEPEGKRERAA